MILELKGIYKEYQQGKMKVPVLKDVNFSMEEGEYVAIMGPSGSGKTTLMNIIGCLDKQTEGTFYLDGQDIKACSENAMSDIRLGNALKLCQGSKEGTQRKGAEGVGKSGTCRSCGF